jgi:hypothetical protein
VVSVGVAALSQKCSPTVTSSLRVGNSGTPYTTLNAALEEARRQPSPKNVTIMVGGGGAFGAPTLSVTSTVNLSSADSCVSVIGCFGGTGVNACDGSSTFDKADHISGATVIDQSSVVLVDNKSNPDAYARLSAEARDHVYQMDIAVMQVINAQQWPKAYTVGDISTRNFAVYFNGSKLRHARWPKAGQNLTSDYPEVPADKQFLMIRTGGVPMKRALDGTSKAWLDGDHKTPGMFAVFEQTLPDLKRFVKAVDHGLWFEVN